MQTYDSAPNVNLHDSYIFHGKNIFKYKNNSVLHMKHSLHLTTEAVLRKGPIEVRAVRMQSILSTIFDQSIRLLFRYAMLIAVLTSSYHVSHSLQVVVSHRYPCSDMTVLKQSTGWIRLSTFDAPDKTFFDPCSQNSNIAPNLCCQYLVTSSASHWHDATVISTILFRFELQFS